MEEKTQEYQPHLGPDELGGNERVLQQDDAQEMAYLEKTAREAEETKKTIAGTELRKDMSDLEDRWKQEDFLQGLNSEQKNNLTIMERLTNKDGKEINTHAFITRVDDKGRKYMILNPIHPDEPVTDEEFSLRKAGQIVYFSVDGIFSLGMRYDLFKGRTSEEVIDMVDWTQLGDMVSNPEMFYSGTNRAGVNLPTKLEKPNDVLYATIERHHITDESDLDMLKKLIEVSENRGIRTASEKPLQEKEFSEALNRLV